MTEPLARWDAPDEDGYCRLTAAGHALLAANVAAAETFLVAAKRQPRNVTLAVGTTTGLATGNVVHVGAEVLSDDQINAVADALDAWGRSTP